MNASSGQSLANDVYSSGLGWIAFKERKGPLVLNSQVRLYRSHAPTGRPVPYLHPRGQRQQASKLDTSSRSVTAQHDELPSYGGRFPFAVMYLYLLPLPSLI